MNKALVLLLTSSALTACSGSGGGGGSDPAIAPDPVNLAPTASDVIVEDVNAGISQVGDLLTASYAYQDAENDLEGDSHLRWYRNGNLIANAISADYVLTQDDAGTSIEFEVTPVALSGELQGKPVRSAEILVDSQLAPEAKDVAITLSSNGPWVGTEVTGSYTYEDVDGDEEGDSLRRWLLDGSEVATGSNKYTLQAKDANKALVFEVTAKAKTGILSSTPVRSEAINVQLQTPPTVNNVAITASDNGPWVGTEVMGTYTYQDGENDLEGDSQLRWLLDGAVVATATNKYMLKDSDVGKSLVFEVTPQAQTGMLIGTVQSSNAITAKTDSAPVISNASIGLLNGLGTYYVGKTLQANYTYSDVEGDIEGESVIEWLRNDAVISGATDKTYVLTKEDAGNTISFNVTPKAVTGLSTGATVSPSYSVDINALPQLSNFKINNSTSSVNAYSGDSIQVTYDYSDAESNPEGIHKFKWYRDGELIPNISWRFYTVTNEDAGKKITFKVTPIATSGSPEGFELTPEISVNVDSNLPPIAKNITVSGQDAEGQAKPGDTLTVNYDYEDVDGDLEGNTIIFWQYRKSSGSGSSSGTISGAYGQRTYTVSAAYAGAEIWAVVTPYAATGAEEGEYVLSAKISVVMPDTTAPILTEQAAVTTPTYDNIVEYTFHSNEPGAISLTGSCGEPSTTLARADNNTVSFGPLVAGNYNDCVITVTDEAGNISLPLNVSPFEIREKAPVNLTLLSNDYTTLIKSDTGEGLDILISHKASCSFQNSDECYGSELLNTANNAETNKITRTQTSYLRVKKNGIESQNILINHKGFDATAYHKVSYYDDRFWLVMNKAPGLQEEAFYTSKDANSWTKEVVPAYVTFDGVDHSQVVYQNKLHFMLGAEHFVYDAHATEDAKWSQIEIPQGITFSRSNTAYTFNNTLFVLGKEGKLLKFDGTTWTKLSNPLMVDGEIILISDGRDFDVVEHNNTLFMFYGNHYSELTSTLLQSSDGINWKQTPVNGLPRGALRGIEAVKVDNKLVAIFYDDSNGQDIYHSVDGQNWSRVSDDTDRYMLQAKFGQEVIAVNEIMYVFGGLEYSSANDSVILNHVWISGNAGLTFGRKYPSGHVPNLTQHRTIVHQGKLWVFSLRRPPLGITYDVLDVWNTEDGITWNKQKTILSDSVQDKTLGKVMEVYTWNGKLFMVSGFGARKIYSSVDGQSWTYEGLISNWSTGEAPRIINNGDHLLLVDDRNEGYAYRSEDGINWVAAGPAGALVDKVQQHQLVKTDSGRILMLGGLLDADSPAPTENVFMSEDNGVSWQASSDLPEAMKNHKAINYKGTVWLFNKNSLYSYNEENDQWLSRGAVAHQSATSENYQVVEFKGRLWMTGGLNAEDKLFVSDDAINWYSFKPVTVEFP